MLFLSLWTVLEQTGPLGKLSGAVGSFFLFVGGTCKRSTHIEALWNTVSTVVCKCWSPRISLLISDYCETYFQWIANFNKMAVASVGLPFHAHPRAPWGAINISMCCHGRAGDNTMTGLLGGDQNEVTEVTEVCIYCWRCWSKRPYCGTMVQPSKGSRVAWVKRQALVRTVLRGFFIQYQKSIARARSRPKEPSMSRPEEAQSHDYGQESSGAAVTDVIWWSSQKFRNI